jgi:hypothetical protein
MKPLRAHDCLPHARQPEPDFKGLDRIMAAFLAAMVFCLVICTLVIIRDAGVHRQGKRQAVTCACTGRCGR